MCVLLELRDFPQFSCPWPSIPASSSPTDGSHFPDTASFHPTPTIVINLFEKSH
jgi:hypothetical protein